MVLDPIPQPLPVHYFGSRPQPPTSPSHQQWLCQITRYHSAQKCRRVRERERERESERERERERECVCWRVLELPWWIYEWFRARLRARLWISIDINVYHRILSLQRITNIQKIYNKDSWFIQNHNKGVRNFDLQTIRRAWDSEKLLALSPWVFHTHITSVAFLPLFFGRAMSSKPSNLTQCLHTHTQSWQTSSIAGTRAYVFKSLSFPCFCPSQGEFWCICAQHTCMNICHACVVFKYWPFATFRQQNFCSRSCMTGTSATMLV